MKIKVIILHIVVWFVINYILLENFSDFGDHSNSVENLANHIDTSNNLPTGIIIFSASYLLIGFILINKFIKKK
jgi:hypothetical protein